MSMKIYFDLDGTVYDLYGQKDWLDKLRNEEKGIFNTDNILFNPAEFYDVISKLLKKGVKFGVITWLSMTSTPEYDEIATAEKKQWCDKYLPFIDTFVAQAYGTPKQQGIIKRTKSDILIDDNAEVGIVWQNGKDRVYMQVTKENNVVTILNNILQILD